jgi:superkiller protein 3
MDPEQSAVSVEVNNEEEVVRQAEALASAGQWREAASLLRQCSQANTLSVEALHKWAYYCSHAGNYDRAITLYKDLSERHPSEAKWFYYLGFQYQRKEQWAEAIAAYKQCLNLAPRWLKAALRLGDAYRGAEQLDKASETYREGIQSYQDLPLSHRRELAPVYAKLCAKMARALLDEPNQVPGELEEAVKLLQESVAIEPNDADNWYRLGCAFLETGQVDEALASLKKAQSLSPKKEYINHKMALGYLKKGDPDQALKAYEQVPEHKRIPYILHGMAQCHIPKAKRWKRPRNSTRR